MLIEKEWCSFGHPFQMRCAHIEDPAVAPEDQAAPIFIQFLDCVWQLLHIYPHWFEFNSRYLLVLAGSLFDARYSTFLFSCHRDRVSKILHFIFVIAFTRLTVMNTCIGEVRRKTHDRGVDVHSSQPTIPNESTLRAIEPSCCN